jgi:hypothetical protein
LLSKDFRQHAVIARIQVLNEDEHHSGVNRQRVKEFLVRFRAASRPTRRSPLTGKAWSSPAPSFSADRFLKGVAVFGAMDFAFA